MFQLVTSVSLLPPCPVPVARFNEYAGTCDLAGLLLRDAEGTVRFCIMHGSFVVLCFSFQRNRLELLAVVRRGCRAVSRSFKTGADEQTCQGAGWEEQDGTGLEDAISMH